MKGEVKGKEREKEGCKVKGEGGEKEKRVKWEKGQRVRRGKGERGR